jgi:hypothetical protein
MRLKIPDREFFRKLLENFIVKIPHFRQCQPSQNKKKESLNNL